MIRNKEKGRRQMVRIWNWNRKLINFNFEKIGCFMLVCESIIFLFSHTNDVQRIIHAWCPHLHLSFLWTAYTWTCLIRQTNFDKAFYVYYKNKKHFVSSSNHLFSLFSFYFVISNATTFCFFDTFHAFLTHTHNDFREALHKFIGHFVWTDFVFCLIKCH